MSSDSKARNENGSLHGRARKQAQLRSCIYLSSPHPCGFSVNKALCRGSTMLALQTFPRFPDVSLRAPLELVPSVPTTACKAMPVILDCSAAALKPKSPCPACKLTSPQPHLAPAHFFGLELISCSSCCVGFLGLDFVAPH